MYRKNWQCAYYEPFVAVWWVVKCRDPFIPPIHLNITLKVWRGCRCSRVWWWLWVLFYDYKCLQMRLLLWKWCHWASVWSLCESCPTFLMHTLNPSWYAGDSMRCSCAFDALFWFTQLMKKNRDIRRHAELFSLSIFRSLLSPFGLSLSKPCNETKQCLHSGLRGICFHPKYVQLRAYSTWREWVCVWFLLALKESNCYKSFEAGTLALTHLFYISNTGSDWMDLI